MTVQVQLPVDQEIVTRYSRSAGEPEWMLQLRLQALEQTVRLDLPKVEKTKIDNWNFTNFMPFRQEEPVGEISQLPAHIRELIGQEDKNVLIQLNGSVIYRRLSRELAEKGVIFTDLQTALKEHGDLVKNYFMRSGVRPDEDRLTSLHTALWSGGLFLYVPKNVVVEEPVLAVFALDGEWNGLVPHVLIAAEANSRLAYVESRLSGDGGSNVHNGITELFVGPGARVTFAGVNRFGDQTVDYMKRIALVQRDGRVEWALGETGNGHSVSENLTILAEDGASSDSKLISVGTGEQRGNYTSKVIHVGKHSDSQILSKGVLLDSASQVFSGITKIEKGATKANGEQTERLLMLSPGARGDANPILLIDEDDVKCGHAASVGKIDEIQLYYLMSRGISRREAERIIIRGFLDPVVSEIPLEAVQRRLKEAIERKLGR